MMAYIECPKCGREVDGICTDPGWALDGREPTDEELLEYFKECKEWVEQERVCKVGEFEPPKMKEKRGAGCGHRWTPVFKCALIDNAQQHTRVYLTRAPGYAKALYEQDCPLSNWIRKEMMADAREGDSGRGEKG